uniref:Uncharacterized protein n=1 Tax=Glossina austeni TaxID=7395 RepID=A0A1A9V7K3_GLOAU
MLMLISEAAVKMKQNFHKLRFYEVLAVARPLYKYSISSAALSTSLLTSQATLPSAIWGTRKAYAATKIEFSPNRNLTEFAKHLTLRNPIYSIIGNQFINMMASIKHGLYELECDVKRVCRGKAAANNVMVKNSKHKITAPNGIQQMLLYSVQSIKSRFWVLVLTRQSDSQKRVAKAINAS